MRTDRKDKAEAEIGAERRGAAVTDERQRDADDGHDAEAHADILDDLDDEHGGDTGTDETAERIIAGTGDEDDLDDEKGI